MDEDGRRDNRLRRTIPGAQEEWVSRNGKSGNALARRRHTRRIHPTEHGRYERVIATGRHTLGLEELQLFVRLSVNPDLKVVSAFLPRGSLERNEVIENRVQAIKVNRF